MIGKAVFWVIVLLTIVGGLGACLSNSLIYAVLFLLLLMGSVGGLYIYLGSPFLGMMQVLIYLGAVGILLVFSVMLAGPFWLKPKERGRFLKIGIGSVLGLGVILVLWKGLSGYETKTGPERVSQVNKLGKLLLTEYALPFELISLLIAISIIGAIMLGILGRKREEKDALE
jgi:NADH-quinone oxidoreductase subunit J